MSELTASRTSITIQCSHVFKDRVRAYAAREGTGLSDALIDLISPALAGEEKMELFIAHTDEQAAKDDYEMLIKVAHDGNQLP